jgi:hypothetical protein
MITTNAQLEQRFNELPDEIAALFASNETSEKIQAIGMKYSLTEKQIETLEIEVGVTLLGEHHVDYFNDIVKELLNDVPEQNLENIIADIRAQIIDENIEMLEAVGDRFSDDEDGASTFMPEPFVKTSGESAPMPKATSPLATTASFGPKPVPVQEQVVNEYDPMPIKIVKEEPKSMIGARLGGQMNVPKQEVTMSPADKSKIPPSKSLNDGQKYIGPDPYREQSDL